LYASIFSLLMSSHIFLYIDKHSKNGLAKNLKQI